MYTTNYYYNRWKGDNMLDPFLVVESRVGKACVLSNLIFKLTDFENVLTHYILIDSEDENLDNYPKSLRKFIEYTRTHDSYIGYKTHEGISNSVILIKLYMINEKQFSVPDYVPQTNTNKFIYALLFNISKVAYISKCYRSGQVPDLDVPVSSVKHLFKKVTKQLSEIDERYLKCLDLEV